MTERSVFDENIANAIINFYLAADHVPSTPGNSEPDFIPIEIFHHQTILFCLGFPHKSNPPNESLRALIEDFRRETRANSQKFHQETVKFQKSGFPSDERSLLHLLVSSLHKDPAQMADLIEYLHYIYNQKKIS